jgi:hypothetical protein
VEKIKGCENTLKILYCIYSICHYIHTYTIEFLHHFITTFECWSFDVPYLSFCVPQLLLEKWPPCQVLTGLEAWVKDKEARLEDQGQATIKACHDADQLRHIIQYYQVH